MECTSEPLFTQCICEIPIDIAAIKAASFLATRSGDLTVASEQAIVWDVVVYDDGGHYSPGTGIYTVPLDGMYLLQTQVTMAAKGR